MKDKKNIDELFKEQLSNFEATPSADVWNTIQAKMKAEKEDRKVIPLWWKVAGIAALLALLFTIGSSVFDDKKATEIVTENTQEKTNTDDTNTTKNTITSSENTVIASEGDTKTETLEETTNASDNNTKANSNNDVFNKTSSSNDAIAVEEIKKEKTIQNNNKKAPIKSNPRFKDNTIESVKETVVATSEKPSEKENVEKNTSETSKKTSDIIDTNKVIVTEKEAVAAEKNASEKEATETSQNKKSIYDAIEESKTEEAVAKIDRSPDNRWDVTPNFAPVYYNSLGEGSSIDPSFADNSQSGDVNFSYGVQVSYNISDRLSLRSGVSNVDLSYATGGVELGTGPVAQALNSVDYGGRQVVLTAFDQGTLMNASSDDPFGNITPKSTSGDVQLIQNISYYEVPLELKYAVLNNKFGVNVIGGLSTLFLGNNDITAQADNFSETLGEANNLSSVSFSTNVGIGFDYKISRKFKFNIEPMFKYQLNPYTDSSVNFRPYYLGVYTGVSFKF